MWNYSIITISAFFITLLVTPIAKKIAFMTNVLDIPTNSLKVHKNPVPYLGGIALLTGTLVALLMAEYVFSLNKTHFWTLFIAAVFITFLGLLDDLFDIKQTHKFTLEIILAVGLFLGGFRVEIFHSIFVAMPLTIFYVVGACNALNILDGLDGLAAGISLIASIFFFVLFLSNKDILGISLSLALIGVCTAFLIYNFNPASIFMGDAGSMFLGLMLSVLMIRYSKLHFSFKSFLIPILICGVPIFDTALTYTRRFVNNKPIFPGDRSHFYDQLIDRGLSTKKTVFLSYVIGIIFGIIALAMKKMSDSAAFLLFIIILFLIVAIIIKLDMIRIRR